jgi:peptidoglycan/LPS O-acetylase OafA/YrhL
MPASGPTIPSGADFSWFGWIGVQVFFVISGAVIAWSATRNTGKGFFIGRVARLWPAMIISATIC